jgi:putative ABC transport system permease protein
MLRNYLAAAFGNLSRNWFYAGVTILGLAAGFAAAMLIGLYVRDEYSFEQFISGYQHAYRLEMDVVTPGQAPAKTDSSVVNAGSSLALDFPDVERVARLSRSSQWVGSGEGRARERVAWVDPDFFNVLAYPVLAGDPVAAMHDPDGVVLTRKMARKYFGQDAPIGKTLPIQSVGGGPAPYDAAHPMRVLAVLKDVPSETHLEQFGIFASGRAAWSGLTFDQWFYNLVPARPVVSVWTYVQLRPGASLDRIRAGLPAFAARHYRGPMGWRLRLEPLKDLHFSGDERTVDGGIAAVGALIILIAAINFVTLSTARATRRAVEVGVRKAVGARRRDLVVQFLGEALIYVFLAMLISVALVELALPSVNAFLQRTIAFDYLSDPWLAAAILGAALVTGVIAGLYPALVLSGFRPASALKRGVGRASGSVGVRQALVVVQFAILTGLIIVAATIWRQTSFALDNLLRLNEDQIIYIVAPCTSPFRQELTAVRGVNAVACASDQAIGQFSQKTLVRQPGRANVSIDTAPIGVGFFEIHGLKPLAGRSLSEVRGEDVVLQRPDAGPDSQPTVVLNESGARQLGFRTPQEAIGKSIDWGRWTAAPPDGSLPAPHSSQIVGVVRDFTLFNIRSPIEPTMYFVDPKGGLVVFASLEGQRLPETLRAIDQLWSRTGNSRPIYRGFLGQEMRDGYRDVMIQEVAIGVSAGLAILIACLGLFALAAFTTERRTKEIGIRKAMGAGTSDVLGLLLWQFTRPVLWANLIAWPVALWAADAWLHGFALRVSLPPWLFLAASAATALIALATVASHAFFAARARPATALRYE